MAADAANNVGHEADGADDGQHQAAGIDETLRELNAARRDTLHGARNTASALRDLAAADFALARSAMGRGLALGGIAALLGSSAWLLLTAVLVAGVHALGLDWVWALLVVALAYLAVAGICVWRMRGYLDHMGMQATRRQLSRLRGKHPQAGTDAPADAAPAAPPPAAAPQGVD
ncbi:phage holin family protein [uncultured Luteimonas sp.]|uniref:phage holin family protein n=1 Tax=uncultured Luteimonas sp. TaxID=453144 RepID=UPI00261A02B8|nr:phage holin family protein [uncultured Luteimonas sp.]